MAVDPSWNSVVNNPSVLSDIANKLGYGKVDDLPPLTQISDAQIQVIQERVSAEVASKVRSLVGQLSHPVLQAADLNLGDASALTLMLMELNAKLGDLQTRFAKEGVQASKLKLGEASKERLGKIQEAIKKMEESAKSELVGKIFGWIGAIVGLIVAVAATILTGGLLAGVAVGLAVVGIGLLVMEETGGMDKMLDAIFKDDDKGKMAFKIALMAIMLVASLATGGAGIAKGAADAAKVAGSATKLAQGIAKIANTSVDTIKTTARMTQVGGSIVSAATAIGGGSAGIHSAVVGHEAAEATAMSKELQAWLAKLQSQLEDEQEALQKAIQDLQTGAFKIPSEILQSIAKSFEAIISQRTM